MIERAVFSVVVALLTALLFWLASMTEEILSKPVEWPRGLTTKEAR